MKRRGMFFNGLIAVFVILAVSVTCMAQTTQPKPQEQPKEQPKEQSKDQPGDRIGDEPGRHHWKIYMENEYRRYYFDPASVKKLDKRVVRVWERITQPDKDGAEVDKVESLMEIDCGSSRYRVIGSRNYESAKPGTKPQLLMENTAWEYFNLDSILGILYDNVCYPRTTPIDAPVKVPEKPQGPPKFKN